MTSVTVSIVLHESAADIGTCLEGVAWQTRPVDRIVVIDNASTDGGLDIVRALAPEATIERSAVNAGFAAAQNRALRLAPADVHVLLNPDCRLSPAFIEHATSALAIDPSAGSVSGRLLRFRAGTDGAEPGPPDELPDDRLDSTGMVGLRNRRVLDRGADTPAAGRYLEPGYVLGVSGAAAVYRRATLEDIAFKGEVFDESFFAFREDVDLAWRAQLLGWRCRYEPRAVARHRRRVTPERRRDLPASLRRRSVANRWRMLAKNELPSGWRRDWTSILWRDLQILGYAVLREQATLPAIVDVVRDARRLRDRRSDIMRRRVGTDASVLDWFGIDDQRPLDAA